MDWAWLVLAGLLGLVVGIVVTRLVDGWHYMQEGISHRTVFFSGSPFVILPERHYLEMGEEIAALRKSDKFWRVCAEKKGEV